MGHKKRNLRDSDEEEDVDHSASDSDVQHKKTTKSKSATSKGKAPSKQKTTKKPRFEESGKEPSPAHEETQQQAVKVLKNAEGEKYVDLGKKKRAAVRSFKGQVFVDMREFYGSDGDEKPGKKGISLTVEQWQTLKKSISTIDSFFAEQGNK